VKSALCKVRTLVFGGVERALHPYGTLPDAGGAVYADALAKCAGSRLWGHMLESCLALGQTQLVRRGGTS
jgi:hypothetical protein